MKYCDSCQSTYPTVFTSCPKDHNPLRLALEFSKGMVIRGKYEILEKIGVGGMAIIYRVRHLQLQEDVALKVVSSRLAEDPAFIDRFRTEAVITRKLRHPNAVRIDDFDTTEEGQPFIVMEYVPGQSLRKLLQNHGLLPSSRAANIAKQVALALGAAHELTIVHRDIKPENILLIPQSDGSDRVKVLDFGIAKVKEGALGICSGHEPTRTGLVLGTPKYLSPEQVKGAASVDARADLYALGVVLYEMLTGRVPFSGSADEPFTVLLQHVQSPPTPPHLLNQAISSAMSELIMKSLQEDPAQRFQTGQEMAEALMNPEILAPSGSGAPVCHRTIAATTPTTAQHRESGEPAISTPTLSHGGGASFFKSGRLGKRTFGVLAGAVVVAVIVILVSGRGINPAGSAEVSDTDVVKKTNAVPARSVTTSRPTHPTRAKHSSSSDQQQEESSAQQRVQAQVLVATGYRRMEQRDFGAARDAFEEALSIDPENSAARKGLHAAKTAETVDGVAGVFGR